jgi:tRNA(Ile)-lysidine synthase
MSRCWWRCLGGPTAWRLRGQIGYATESGRCSQGDGLEAAARQARYEFLQTAAEQLGARYVVTAHTASDQAETILHHILRGTGLAGLGGMRRVRPLGPAVTLIRPLLEVTRRDVLDYLAALGQSFREDHTNADPQFTRNRIRNELLPLIERNYAPQVVAALLRLGNLAGDTARLVDSLTGPLLERCLASEDARGVTLDCRTLAAEDRHLVRELFLAIWRRRSWPLQAMGFGEWNRLADLALRDSDDAHVLPGAVRAQRSDDRLRIER